MATVPCEASELVHFRKRIGESGIELIFKESIRINGNGNDSDDPYVNADTTIQEKNITFPMDSKLHKKMIKTMLKIVQDEQLPIRQSYKRILKKLSVDQRFRNHPRNKSKARKADKKVKNIAGLLVRELERNLSQDWIYQKTILFFKQVPRPREVNIKYTRYMSQMYSAFPKVKSIRNMSSEIKSPS